MNCAHDVEVALLELARPFRAPRDAPPSSRASSSPMARALGMLCVTTTSVTPLCGLSFDRAAGRSPPAVIGSRPALGSSTSRIAGSSAMARARPARLRMPPERRAGILSYSRSRPTSASSASRALADLAVAQSRCGGAAETPRSRRRRSSRRAPRSGRGSRCAGAAGSARPRQRGDVLRPPRTRCPRSGFTRPTMCRSVTLLPVPLRPSRQNAASALHLERHVVQHAAVAERLRDVRRAGSRGPSRAGHAPPACGIEEEDQPDEDDVRQDDQDRREARPRASTRGPRPRCPASS